MLKMLVLSGCLLLATLESFSQDKWDLRRCVEYAVANNLTVKQADIDARTAKLSYEQAKWAKVGNLNSSSQLGLNFGNVIDPTTNLFDQKAQSIYQNINLQAGVTLFNWFSLKRLVESNRFYAQAQTINIDKIKNDITLNVAAAYLTALLAREQVNLGNTKLGLTKNQLSNTRKLVDAGSVPELNAAELEAQFASDTAALITAQETYSIDVLQLKAILNFDVAAPLMLDTPAISTIPVEPITELQPDLVYGIAVSAFPQQRINDLRILSAQKNVDAYKGQLYPTFTGYGSLSDYFNNNLKQGFKGYGTQLNNFFGQQVGVQVNIPIFSGLVNRTNYRKSKLNVETANVQKQTDLLNLKQSIYQAYYNAVASLEKFQAGKTAVSTAERSFDLSSKRYNIGLLNTIDYLTNQNNLFTARINQLAAQYDYVFRMKVLEYYKGLGIKL